ncbi:hypothetical protein AYI70_g2703 [Smittium culicis]|uniref:Uncharacterized protein n=1 Tax=Smittium culicis TaxID=133412 RepID=A0A1R1Y7C3_9FUNG|nr:hypothetical protein AYI70_g2703 [Smittium culicis]
METDKFSSIPQLQLQLVERYLNHIKPSDDGVTGYKKVDYKSDYTYKPVSIMEMVSDSKRKILFLKFKDEASKNKFKSKEIESEKKTTNFAETINYSD